MYSEISGLTFTQINAGGTSENATVLFGAYTSATDVAGAYAYFPGSAAAASLDGDVWLNNDAVDSSNLRFGTYSFYTMIHELGHAVGLSHPGDYNAAPGVSITYAANAQFIQDSQQYTIMSYFSETNTGADFGGTYADTLMLYDIFALHQLYGADLTTRSGATVYGFNSNAGAVYNFAINIDPALCIWDGAGIDTIDLSGWGMTQTLNLNEGTFSNVGGLAKNLSIAYGAVIENAVGGSGIDTILGNSAANTLYGLGGSDQLSGGMGSDRLYGGAGADLLNGGADNDRLVGDGAVDWTNGAQSIYRLYISSLGRAPDDGGLLNWTTALEVGQSLTSIAQGFVASAEFTATYGTLNNTQFVTLLYDNVLGRAPDPAGLNSWVTQLNNGATRANVVLGFSESGELRASSDITGFSGQVYRLYDSAFNRAPDAPGFLNWVDTRTAGATLPEVINSFIGSAEFTNTYGQTSNTAFVQLLYTNVLNRGADPTGLNNWVSQLNNGTSRAQVLLGFSESAEHIGLMATGLNSYMNTVPNFDRDTLNGGSGVNSLTGGRGADIFVFNNADNATTTVYGFEVFDTLNMTGFGFTAASQAVANITQQGTDAVFTYQGDTIIFANTALATLQAVDATDWQFA